jgi:FG-GAP repeat
MRALVMVSPRVIYSVLVGLAACSSASPSGPIPATDAGPGGSDAPANDAPANDAPTGDGPAAVISVPSSLAPMRNAYLGSVLIPASLRPTFTWTPSTSSSGTIVSYQFEISTDASFAVGVTRATTSSTSYTPPASLAVSADAPVGARYYWRVKACTSPQQCSAYSSPWWVNLGRSERDLNGDGFADVIVGASGNDGGGSAAGRAYIYFGDASGDVDAVADGTLTGAAADDSFGGSVAAAGDVNGDGFADVIVGARFNSGGGSKSGRAYVYFGAAGTSFDASADGVLTGAAAFDNFGTSVASAGDVNGDGFFDVIVGAPGNDTGGMTAGRTYLYFGAAGTTFDASADGVLTGASNDNFGIAAATAGDVNGDGFADVIVGAWFNSAGGANAGRAYLYFGAAGATFDASADGTLTGAAAGDLFGSSVASAGDVNNDGFADVIVGAYFNDGGGANAGRAYLYFGTAGATFDASADGTLTGATAGEVFGSSVASAGDVNGDGFSDVIVGAPLHNEATGRTTIYFGAAGTTFDAGADASIAGAAASDGFAIAVAAAGDVNGDGFADVVVGAYFNDAAGTDAGRAYVYFGGAGSFDATADGIFTGAATGDLFGISVASAWSGVRRAPAGVCSLI